MFDGGAPILKRQTVSGRKARREGRREDAVRTAGKLLAVQMQRRAEEEDVRRREERENPARNEEDGEEEVPENPVYVDELQMTAQERQQNRTFRKKDAYHLPNLDVDLADMGAPNDPRIMSHEELEEYARQFHTGEDVNVYDFSKIDFESPFFLSLPASDRYNILNAARLRSRLRMGYSKEQLDTMFPNRMDFSRFQIERVTERNELTQRLMNINGMNGEDAMAGTGTTRVAGERGKEYVLVKNDGVEGGWALGVVSNKEEGQRARPIDVEGLDREEVEEEGDWEEEGFEDVPIEGLNRLPKRKRAVATVDVPFESEEMVKQRTKLYKARLEAAGGRRPDGNAAEEEPDSLFVQQQENGAKEDENMDDLFEDVPAPAAETEEEELNRAIAMSLENHEDRLEEEEELPTFSSVAVAGPRIDKPLDFNQKNAKAGRDAAHLINARAQDMAPRPFAEDSDDEDLQLQAALNESRRTKYKRRSPQGAPAKPAPPLQSSGFDGPLPFESLTLGKSILGQKKRRPAEEQAGGFEKESAKKDQETQPLPPWFSGDIREENAKQDAIEGKQFEGAESDRRSQPLSAQAVLRKQETGEVIDLDAPKEKTNEVIAIASSEEEEEDDVVLEAVRPLESEVKMGDLADLTRAEPPVPSRPQEYSRLTDEQKQMTDESIGNTGEEMEIMEDHRSTVAAATKDAPGNSSESEEPIDWSESEAEEEQDSRQTKHKAAPAGGHLREASKSQSPDFENVGNPDSTSQAETSTTPLNDVSSRLPPSLPLGQSSDGRALEALAAEDENDYSDPDDEDLMAQLAVEAEEHARFASTLNQKSQLENAEDYEKELRQLRNQQKKDRRDADEVTHIMVTECQQLLTLFGLPYVTAPMEAEAQCATLVSLGLVDGIVTDDSDIFLFGGTRVYKNMFNQAKFVECYLASDLEKEYSLTRKKLIRFAHLLGSDYTEGIPSVGPVTALEILSEFETLESFSDWWASVQMGQAPVPSDHSNAFRHKFRKNAAKIFLPTTFPDTRVDYAYLNPEVDKDPEPFQWGVPDLDALRRFLMATIGWSQERTDEVLVPVIRDMNRRENEGTQSNITQFFQGGVGVGASGAAGAGAGAFAPRRRVEKSKRMESALGRLHERAQGRTAADGAEEPADGNGDANGVAREERPKNARAKKRVAPVDDKAEDESLDDDAEYTATRKSRKGANALQKSRRKKRAAA